MKVCRRDSREAPTFFQAEDGIRDAERSRGLGDVYKRQEYKTANFVDQHTSRGSAFSDNFQLYTGENYIKVYLRIEFPKF